MKIGDLIKFKGTWGASVKSDERRIGIVMEVWTNGLTQKQQSADVIWDNGDFTQSSVHLMEVINESSLV